VVRKKRGALKKGRSWGREKQNEEGSEEYLSSVGLRGPANGKTGGSCLPSRRTPNIEEVRPPQGKEELKNEADEGMRLYH